MSARFRAATNVPIVGYYQRLGDVVALGDERNRVRLSDYVRLDLRANRTFDVRHGRATLFVEVLNATGRRNQRALEQPFYTALRASSPNRPRICCRSCRPPACASSSDRFAARALTRGPRAGRLRC